VETGLGGDTAVGPGAKGDTGGAGGSAGGDTAVGPSAKGDTGGTGGSAGGGGKRSADYGAAGAAASEKKARTDANWEEI